MAINLPRGEGAFNRVRWFGLPNNRFRSFVALFLFAFYVYPKSAVSRLPMIVHRPLLFLLFFACNCVYAQGRLTMFTECECNQTLLKQELNYVNHSIDPVGAQINLFIVTTYLSNGGRVYDLSFKGQEELDGNELNFKVSTTAIMTGRERDELLTHRIELGLLGFLAGTPYADLATVELDAADLDAPEAAADSTAGEAASPDNWNNWIFDINARFNTEVESQRSLTDLHLRFDADQTTPEWRTRFRVGAFYRTQNVVQSDGTELTSFREDLWSNASVVRSISDHFSVGLFASGSSSTFRNIDLSTWLAPAIEYNFFSYDEVPFKEFTIAYRMGWRRNDYTEETIFLETRENLIRQAINADLRIRQRWGNIFAGISGGHFLNDFAKNRVSLSGRANVRLFKGLSFSVGGSYEIINDQISLPRGEASVEDVLLGQSQLATNFETDLSFGLNYTFGSLFNNVINTRL